MIDPVALEKAAEVVERLFVDRPAAGHMAREIIEAYLEAAKPAAARLALHPTVALNFLDAQAHKWAEEVHLLAMAEAITNKPDRLARIIALARQSFVEGAYRAACELSPAAAPDPTP